MNAMSVRALGTRSFRHVQTYLRQICKRDKATIAEKFKPYQNVNTNATTRIAPRNAFQNVGLQFTLHARRIFIDNVLNRVTNSLASDLRKKAARRYLFGDSGPLFALIGISLASGTGILTKEDEQEGVCWEIREAISKIHWVAEDNTNVDESKFENEEISLKDLILNKPIAKGANAVVYAGNLRSTNDRSDPLAVKMMFNYDIQSNATAIFHAMYRETVPARYYYYSKINIYNQQFELSREKISLPPHPNVVTMYTAFTDYVPELLEAVHLYPAALPRRIHPDGEGRNMSLFLVMKRYDQNLQDYLASNTLTLRTSILLFVQLLEGVLHINSHNIAHRDIKSDNLLLDTSDSCAPVLVISDFGCCLADKNNGLMLPYTSYEVDKGGNAALMAPEIITQRPGSFSILNYSKSDTWAVGTIAHEIFGNKNPFYNNKDTERIRSVDYNEEQLPQLPQHVPPIIKALVRNMLQRNPNKRLDPEIAANVCQLFLWAPSSWLKTPDFKLPSSTEILQWLLCLATKVLCEGRLHNQSGSLSTSLGNNTLGRPSYCEYLIIGNFLRRAKLASIRTAINWIHNNTQ